MNRRHQLHSIVLLAALLVGFILAMRHVALPWAIAGPSMLPALAPGDRVLVDPWSFRYRLPRPGEVVLFDGPAAQPDRLVKRVAVPPAAARAPLPGPWGGVVGEDWVWVLGDNTAQSLDSRRFGAVPAERVVGRVFWRYWPLSRVGPVPEAERTGLRLPVR